MNKKLSKFCKKIKEIDDGINIISNLYFKDLTTFKIGGKIKCLIEIKQVTSLLKVMAVAKQVGVDYFILGAGSNILVSDKVCNKVVIKICLDEIVCRNNLIVCGAGVKLFKLNNFAIKNCLSGLEFSYGIPGTVGGAVKMNAGCFKKEFKDVVKSVFYTDGERIYKKDIQSLDFSYRHSFFSNNNYVILKVVLNLKKDDSKNIEKRCFQNYEYRRKTQPYNSFNAGSIFKRPSEKVFVPVLIEKCNLKGYKIGDAEISKKHCGFIVNNKNATFNQVFKLISKIKKTVYKKFDIILKEEIIILK